MRTNALTLFFIALLVFGISAITPFSTNVADASERTKKPELKIKVTIGDKVLIAKLEDNLTSRAFVKMLPRTLPMLNLYGRELVYRFPDPLPTDRLRSDEYGIGDIVYWPPRHSFVILYKQTGERFSRQQVGHIDSDLSFLNGIGDVDVVFELTN